MEGLRVGTDGSHITLSGGWRVTAEAEKAARARRSRDRAYAARRAQRAILGGRGGGVRAGRCGLELGGDIDVDWHGGKRLIAGGYESCGWLGCAVCGRAVRARRCAEIIVSAHRWQADRDGHLIMLTLAPPHHPGDELADTFHRLDLVWRQCQRKATLGRRWREQWSVRHQWTSWEATVGGASGDHPHLHVLLYLERRCDPEELAGDLLARLHVAGFTASRRGHPELAEALQGWTLAGLNAVEAGPGAGAYVAKLTEGLDDEEMAELLGLGLELTDVAGAKTARGGVAVPVTAVAAVVAERAHQAGVRPRYHLGQDRLSARLAAALRAWREVTFGRPVLYASRGLRAELIPEFEDLDDEQCVAQAQQLEAFDRAKIAETLGVAQPEPSIVPAGCDSDVEEVDEHRRPFRVARDVLACWADLIAGTDDSKAAEPWGGPEAALCRWLERVGPWRVAAGLAAVWEVQHGREAHVWQHAESGRLRVGAELDYVFDEWAEVDAGELQRQCGWPSPQPVLNQSSERRQSTITDELSCKVEVQVRQHGANKRPGHKGGATTSPTIQ